jgi:CBS domain containing-hemolysin-like protein
VTVWFLLLAVLLLVANGFFVAVEFALIASRRTKLETEAEAGSITARLAVNATRELSLQLAGAQLGITMASLGLGAVAEPAVAHLVEDAIEPFAELPSGVLHSVSFTVALTIVVFLHLVVGEMVPKNVALAAPEQTMRLLAVPNRIYVTLFGPVIRTLNALANAGVRVFGIEPRDELAMAHTADELSGMLAASREEGLIEELAHDLLSGALDFGERPVRSVMVPRERVVSVPRTATIEEAEALAVDSGISRLLVTGRDLDDIVGFVHVKDLLTVLAGARRRPIPVSRIRRVLIVTPERPLDEVLVAMRRGRAHVAVVRASGRTLGVATLEDLVEHLVGDIRDESDPGGRPPRRVAGRRRSRPVTKSQ